MDERKIPQESQEQTDEYSFLQEVIKDEAGSKTQVKRKTLRMVGYGLVFGVIASFSFCASKPWFEHKFSNNLEQVTIPMDQEDQEEEEPKEEQSKPGEEEELDTQHYRRVLQALNKVAEKTGKSLVEVTGVTGKEDWTKESDRNKQSVPGVVIADNGKELLILGKIVPVKNAKNIQVTFRDGDRYDAVEKMSDHNLELCIYAVKRNKIAKDVLENIQIAKLGNSNLVEEKDTVIFHGKPFGYASVVGYGTILSHNKEVEKADGAYKLLYTDISGSKEGSGILTDISGNIIGVVDQKSSDNEALITGYSISEIKEVIELLSNGKCVPYIGICGTNVTENMEEIGLSKGIYVREVEADSPAMKAGIQSGDVIRIIDDVECENLSSYHNILMQKKEGSEICLKVSRQGADKKYVDIEFTVTVGSKK